VEMIHGPIVAVAYISIMTGCFIFVLRGPNAGHKMDGDGSPTVWSSELPRTVQASTRDLNNKK
jgi:hypothetical protein